MEYPPDQNPARTFYKFWSKFLRETEFSYSTFGTRGWMVTTQGSGALNKPILGFGTAHNRWAHLLVQANGDFRIRDLKGGWGAGTERRNGVRAHSFLAYDWFRGDYQWFVETSPFGSAAHYARVSDPGHPRAYVAESMLSWDYDGGVWQSLSLNDRGEWAMRPAKSQRPDYSGHKDKWARLRLENIQKAHDRYQDLVTKRYYQLANPQAASTKNVSERVASVRTKSGLLVGGEAIDQMIALLDVSSPAKTTPLLRSEAHKEAHNGDHLVTEDAV